MSYKRLTILVDMDSIVANLQKDWHGVYNKDYDDDLDETDVKTWDTHLYVKKECGTKIYSYLKPSLFLSLDPIEGAIEALEELHNAGHEIVFVTASPKGCADAKVKWTEKHFKWMTHKDVIIGHKKHLVRGDVFIDDSPSNLKNYHMNNPETMLMTIAYPYNKECENICALRAGTLHNKRSFWKAAVELIEQHAKDSYNGV